MTVKSHYQNLMKVLGRLNLLRSLDRLLQDAHSSGCPALQTFAKHNGEKLFTREKLFTLVSTSCICILLRTRFLRLRP